MFTGIVETRGVVKTLERSGHGAKLHVKATLSGEPLAVGESIAVNGACLTVVEVTVDGFVADISPETLNRTTLGQLNPNDSVNLERALTPQSRLGGHIVTGHIDATVRVLERSELGEFTRFVFELPQSLAKYVAEKGSIAVDGISLTVNRVLPSAFEVMVIPHTLSLTTLESRRPGDLVNLEVDLLARYVERMLAPTTESKDERLARLLED